MYIAIDGIGEIELFVPGVDGYIVDRVELTTKEVVQESLQVSLLLMYKGFLTYVQRCRAP